MAHKSLESRLSTILRINEQFFSPFPSLMLLYEMLFEHSSNLEKGFIEARLERFGDDIESFGASLNPQKL